MHVTTSHGQVNIYEGDTSRLHGLCLEQSLTPFSPLLRRTGIMGRDS